MSGYVSDWAAKACGLSADMDRRSLIFAGAAALAGLLAFGTSGASEAKAGIEYRDIEQLGEGIEMVTSSDGLYNTFFLDAGDGYVMVDTYFDDFRDEILSAVEGRNIKLIVLTHAHYDHCGCAAELAKLTGAPIAMCEADLDLIADNWAQPIIANEDIEGTEGFYKVAKEGLQNYPFEEFEPTVFLEDGDTLEEWGVPYAKVMAVPGHTNGSIALDVNGTDLITGDCVINIMGHPTPAMIVHHKSLEAMTLNRIADMGPRNLLYAHGMPTQNWVPEYLGR